MKKEISQEAREAAIQEAFSIAKQEQTGMLPGHFVQRLLDIQREAVEGLREISEALEASAIGTIELCQDYGTPGIIVGWRCKLCNHDWKVGDKPNHDCDCHLIKLSEWKSTHPKKAPNGR